MTFDSDEQVQSVIRCSSRNSRSLARTAVLVLVQERNQHSRPPRYAPNQDSWSGTSQPVHTAPQLASPQYAGAYAYGRSLVDSTAEIPGRLNRYTDSHGTVAILIRTCFRLTLPGNSTWEQERLKQKPRNSDAWGSS